MALLERLGRVADPDAALRRLHRLPPPILERVLDDPSRAAPLLAAFGFSEWITDVVVNAPAIAGELLGDPPPERTGLFETKQAALARIAATDLATAPTRESFTRTGTGLAAMADEGVRAALGEVAPGGALAVMAMGKYGGSELNYASDIDVLFVFGRGDADDAERSARRVMARLAGPPAVLRVDADLRPQGKDGPLARSLDAYRAYYARWAEAWEFQSLIKCRLAGGDAETGMAFLELIRPHVWPEKWARQTVQQIRALKERVERMVDRSGLSDRQLKLAPGGIRDVEFAVQLLQLVHGRAHEELRSPNTLEALDALGAGGFVAESDASELAAAYVFLRHLEHRLQLVGGRQTHTLPDQPDAREHLARGLGYRDTARQGALERFERDYRERTGLVRRIHEKLFYRPLLDAFAAAPAIGPSLEPEEAADRLRALGFDRPPASRDAIIRLTTGPSRHAKVMRAILPGLLAWLAETPEPDAGLRRLADLAMGLEERPHMLATLRDEPAVAELLSRTLGSGPVLAELMLRDPALLAELSRPGSPSESHALAVEASALVRARPGDEARAALLRFRRVAFLRTAARDIASGEALDAFASSGRELSATADACLEAANEMAAAEAAERAGGRPEGGFAVVGMGRLGGSELGYGSDLDVMFVYEKDALCPDGSESRLFHSRVAERIVEILSSVPPIFVVDPELRPEGRNGPIIRSLASYAAYYERWAKQWEFQALTRARHSAGEARVTQMLLSAVEDRVWPPALSAGQVAEIRHMKARMERERLGRGQDRMYQVKLGLGGLADIEFTVQLEQMRHGHAHPERRTPNTLDGIGKLEAAGLVAAPDAAWLRDAYLMLNRVRNHLYLLRGVSTDALPTADDELEQLARSLGYGRLSRSRFLEDYRRVTRRARAVCNRIFYGEAS
jgi:glutamate-ammonia-ligase adenylyltransferase